MDASPRAPRLVPSGMRVCAARLLRERLGLGRRRSIDGAEDLGIDEAIGELPARAETRGVLSRVQVDVSSAFPRLVQVRARHHPGVGDVQRVRTEAPPFRVMPASYHAVT